MNNNKKIQTYFFSFLLLATTVLMGLVFYPFIGILAIAIVLAITFHPLFEKLKIILKKDWLSASVVILILAVFIIIPLILIGWQIFQEIQSLYFGVSANKFIYLDKINTAIERPLQNFIPNFSIDFESYVESLLIWLIDNLGLLISKTTQILFNILLTIIALFFFLKDGEKIKKALILISPLEDKYDNLISQKLDSVVNSVMRGTIFVAMIQGLAAGIGFWIFGIPSPTFWGTIAAIASLIPGFGTAVVIIPALIYLLFNGTLLATIGFGIWGVVVVGLIDNILHPIAYKRGVSAHPIFIFFAIFGGIYLFGPMGLIFGPIVLSFYITLLEIYKIVSKTSE